MTENLTTTCANHPNRPTALRCNRCEKYICSKCAVLTPTGYRCKECVNTQQKVFDTAQWYDYFTGSITAAALSYLAGLLLARLGFFVLILGPMAGVAIAEAVRFIIHRRRSRRLFIILAAATALGALPHLLGDLAYLLTGYVPFFNLLWDGLYIVVVTSTMYSRLSGLFLRR